MKITQATRRDTGKMVYLVQSERDANHWHIVHRTLNGFECSCKDFTYRKSHRTSRRDCKHIYAVKMEVLDAMNEIGAKFLPPMKPERKEAARPKITQESLASALKTISPDTELAAFQGNGQESRNGTAIVAVERAIRKTMGREVTAGMSHLTTEDGDMHEMDGWYRQMMTDAAWVHFTSIRVGDLLQSIVTKEQPMQEPIILCKKCGKRCNGQTGLCYRCEQEQRKAQACTRSSRWNDERVFDPISGWKSAS